MKAASLCLLLAAAACRHEVPPAPTVLVTIVNDHGEPICDVHFQVAAHHAAGWGTDWLDRSESVGPGLERSFRLPPGETWNVLLRGCGGQVLATASDLQWPSDQPIRISASDPSR